MYRFIYFIVIYIIYLNLDLNVSQVLGEGGVMIVDVRNIEEDSDDNGDYIISNIIVHYLTELDTINFSTMDVSYAPYKTLLTGQYSSTSPPAYAIVDLNLDQLELIPVRAMLPIWQCCPIGICYDIIGVIKTS